jgi:drug/metabolite transporter (DMT)-like permease
MSNNTSGLTSVVRRSHNNNSLPVISTLIGAVFWGLLWWPLKFFAAFGLTGNLIGITAYGMVGIVAIPIVWLQRKLWRDEWLLLVLIGLFFAVANITFTTALIQGEVVRVMLLFYLLPVWGALGGVLVLGESLSKKRCVAIALSLSGVFVIMGGDSILSQPFSCVDIMALVAGFCLSATSVINKLAIKIPMASRSFVPFIFCPILATFANQIVPVTMPELSLMTWGLLACFAFIWIFGGTLLGTYGQANIEASKVSILQVTELFVAIISAVFIGREILETKEYIGGALIVSATLLETLEIKSVYKSA